MQEALFLVAEIFHMQQRKPLILTRSRFPLPSAPSPPPPPATAVSITFLCGNVISA